MDMQDQTTQQDNIYEIDARQRKAHKLAAMFLKKGITAGRLRRIIDQDDFWVLAAQQAGTKMPSRETRLVAISEVSTGDHLAVVFGQSRVVEAAQAVATAPANPFLKFPQFNQESQGWE